MQPCASGVSSKIDCEHQISELEIILDSQVHIDFYDCNTLHWSWGLISIIHICCYRYILLRTEKRWKYMFPLQKKLADFMTNHGFPAWIWKPRWKPHGIRYFSFTSFTAAFNFVCLSVRTKTYLFHGQFDALLLKLPVSQHSHYKDIDEKLKTLRKRLFNDLAKILYCLDDLGPICAYEV